ncbi:MAG: MFS transporter, partial [Actinobacteria bacterium]|nr:MFS transporter [Actinomycetota bacterium]
TFLLVMLSMLAYFTAVGAIIPTLPRYVEGPLGGGGLEVGAVIGAFALTAVLLRPLSGRLSDKRGRRLLIIFGGISVGLSIFAYSFSESLPLLIFWRLVTGVGEAFFYVGAASVINDLAPDERRGEALSYFSLALFGGLAIGPVTGETILEASSYNWVWLFAGAAGLFSGFVGFLVPETRPPDAGDSPGKLVHGAAILPGTVLATNIWALATFSSFMVLHALDIGMSGGRYAFALNSAVIIGIRLFGARLPDKLGAKKAGSSALVSVMVGMLVMGLWAEPAGLYVGTFIYSIGHALAFPALMTFAISRAPASERGAVIGTFTAFFDLSFGVGAVSAGAIADAIGYRGAFVAASGVALAGLVLLLGAARNHTRRTTMSERALAEAATR